MAFLHDSHPKQPFLRAPAGVLWLILILIAAHALRVFVFERSGVSWFFEYGFVPARYSRHYLESHGFNPGSPFERVLPFFSYIFLHASFAHVIVNCVWLLAFGPVVARRFGTVLFLVFFLVCGAAGAAAHLALNWGSDNPVIGASAAVSGLMAAGFRMLPLPAGPGRQPLASVLAPRVLLWTAVWVLVNVVAGLTGLGAGGRVELVAWQAHIGGYAAGLILAWPFDFMADRDARRRRTA